VLDWLNSLFAGQFGGLLAGFLIALVTTGITTFLTLRRQRRSEWQRWLQEAAANFGMKLRGASTAVEYAVFLPEGNLPVVDQEGKLQDEHKKAFDDAQWLVNETQLSLSQVQLLFGEARHSAVRDAARGAIENLRQAIKHLEEYHKHLQNYPGDTDSEDLGKAQKCLEESQSQEKKFVSEAYAAIRKAG
jgi:type I restriction-modification system DNA methylase subunit